MRTVITFAAGIFLSCLGYILWRRTTNQRSKQSRRDKKSELEAQIASGEPLGGATAPPAPGEWLTPVGATAPGEWLTPEGIDRQYQNRSAGEAIRDRHPVLAYQMAHSGGIIPATLGDPIRPPDIAGPMNRYGPEYNARLIRPGVTPWGTTPAPWDSSTRAWGSSTQGAGGYARSGVDPSGPQGVPVPMGTLKFTSERYNPGQFGTRPSRADFLRSFGTELPVGAADFLRSFNTRDTGMFEGGPGPSCYGSVDAYSPFPEITSPWENAGILTTELSDISPGNRILALYRRAIAPAASPGLWEYQVRDRDGFVIKLRETYIEDGDMIRHVIGKEGMGPWKANIFIQNKYVWV